MRDVTLEIIKDLVFAKSHRLNINEEVELNLNLTGEIYNELMSELNSLRGALTTPSTVDINFTTFNFMGAKCYIQQSDLKNKDTRDFLQAYEYLKK